MAGERIALVGDAAHPMLPYLAQGAGMAIEDGVALAEALDGCTAEEVPPRLARYADARWERNAQVQARARRNGEIFHATGLMRLGRDTALRLLGARLLDVPWLYGA
jgi:salicylate hydroxylase